jgi:membrane-bound lytic murein transglycosylase MltF
LAEAGSGRRRLDAAAGHTHQLKPEEEQHRKAQRGWTKVQSIGDICLLSFAARGRRRDFRELVPRFGRLRHDILVRLIRITFGFAFALAVFFLAGAVAAQDSPTPGKSPRHLKTAISPRTGDFDKILERRLVRVAVPYSRTLYYVDRGQERGITAGLLRDFERFLNAKYKALLGKRPLSVTISATTRDQLIPMIVGGMTDIAVGNLTITPERLRLVDMQPIQQDIAVREILVTGPKSPPISGIDDLAGKAVHVRRTSSYYDSLVALNARLLREHRSPVTIVLVPDALEDEDLMEMLNAGLLRAIVVDDWKEKLWAPMLPKLVVHSDIVLHDGGHLGWIVRKDSPLLKAEIADFFQNWVKTHGTLQFRLVKATSQIRHLGDPTTGPEWKRFQAVVSLFEKYGAQYDFDPLMLTAQGYQESQLNQNAHSPVGAIGVMQLMPTTGAQLKVGDIRQVEANIHAGAKYMDNLMARYFADANFTETNRTLFAFAAYNCGPGNVVKARAEATRRGLDPNRWFNNVEIVIAEKIGMETTTYVRNIFKYYIAYKLVADAKARAEAARAGFSNQKN